MFSGESTSGEFVEFVTLEQDLGPSVREEATAAAFNFSDGFDSRNLALEQLSRLLVVILVQYLRKSVCGSRTGATPVRRPRYRRRAVGAACASVEIQSS